MSTTEEGNIPQRSSLGNRIDVLLDGKELSLNDNVALFALKALHNTSPEAASAAAKVVKDVALHTEKFNYVLVTGGSGMIVKMILTAAGVPADKIKIFDSETNQRVYRQNYFAVNYQSSVSAAREALSHEGVDFTSKPSICVVDERVYTGNKLLSYIGILSHIKELGEIGFTAFSAPIAGEDRRENMFEMLQVTALSHCEGPNNVDLRVQDPLTGDKLMNLAGKSFWVPSMEVDENRDTIFFQLAYMYQLLDSSSNWGSSLSDEVREIAREVVSDIVQRITSDKTKMS